MCNEEGGKEGQRGEKGGQTSTWATATKTTVSLAYLHTVLLPICDLPETEGPILFTFVTATLSTKQHLIKIILDQ